jgi:hypothetical protein
MSLGRYPKPGPLVQMPANKRVAIVVSRSVCEALADSKGFWKTGRPVQMFGFQKQRVY